MTPTLTKRNRELLALIGECLSDKEIAVRMRLSVPSTKNAIHRLRRKTGKNRYQLVIAGYLAIQSQGSHA